MDKASIREIGTTILAVIVVGGGGYVLSQQPMTPASDIIAGFIGVVVTAYFGNHVVVNATNGQLTAINQTADRISAAREQAAETAVNAAKAQ